MDTYHLSLSQSALYCAIHAKVFSQEDKCIKTLVNSGYGQNDRSIRNGCGDKGIMPTTVDYI